MIPINVRKKWNIEQIFDECGINMQEPNKLSNREYSDVNRAIAAPSDSTK